MGISNTHKLKYTIFGLNLINSDVLFCIFHEYHLKFILTLNTIISDTLYIEYVLKLTGKFSSHIYFCYIRAKLDLILCYLRSKEVKVNPTR